MNDGLTLPLEVRSYDGSFLGALLTNRKAYQKSLERHELWFVHPVNHRVLPLEGVGFVHLETSVPTHYRVVLDANGVKAFQKERDKQMGDFLKLDSVGPAPGDLQHDPSNPKTQRDSTLEMLRQVIAGRRKDMPEGSYTTHLFTKGEDKIRKKTGEEAIELILATDRKEMIGEAADLIYHMMVLLEVKDIPIAEVLAELEARLN
ncbi:MAG: phosphoribosyl-ATP diphosphatase [Spirochaetales bacterium]